MEEKKKNTTVTIDSDTSARLERLSKANGVSKKDFLSLALEYFEKYGINPAQHESPAQEMQKLIKRIDQVVAFQRAQERDFIRPAIGSIMETEERINREIDGIAKQSSVKDIASVTDAAYNRLLQGFKDAVDKNNSTYRDGYNQLRRAIETLAQHMDEKNKAGLMGKLFG